MTGRERRGSSPGRGLAGALAVAALFAIGVQGAILAGPDKPKDRDHRKGEAAKQGTAQKPAPAPVVRQDRQAVRTVGGVQVSINPATGRLQPPTAEEAAALAAGLQSMLSRDPDSLEVIELADGTRMVNLEDTFQDVAIATKGKRGNTTLHCVNDSAKAAQMLDGTAPEAPDAIDLSTPAGRRAARKPSKTNLEKE